MKRSPVDFVEPCYSVESFLSTYSNVLSPMNGMELWDTSRSMQLRPPKYVRLGGRPKKNRRKQIGEVRKVGSKEVLVRWTKAKCRLCRQETHNKRTCPMKGKIEEPPQRMKTDRPRGRPPKARGGTSGISTPAPANTSDTPAPAPAPTPVPATPTPNSSTPFTSKGKGRGRGRGTNVVCGSGTGAGGRGRARGKGRNG